MVQVCFPEFVSHQHGLVKNAVLALCENCGNHYVSEQEIARWQSKGAKKVP